MKIAVATDTNSGITMEAGRKRGIYVLPMPVMIDGNTYFEGMDITNEQLYDAMKQHRDISTSQPSPGQLIDFWDEILQDGYEEIVYIPMSSGLSASCESAMMFAKDYDGKIQVVDNHRISVTQEESVYAALELAKQGYTAAQIKMYLEKWAYDASIYVSVDSMEYLKKGGRVTPAAATIATVLNLKPVLTIQGDKLDAYAKVRGMKQAEAKMIEAVKHDRETRFAQVPDSLLQIETAGTFEKETLASAWLTMVQNAFPDIAVSYVHLPCSLSCHVGMNAAGVAIMKKGQPDA